MHYQWIISVFLKNTYNTWPTVAKGLLLMFLISRWEEWVTALLLLRFYQDMKIYLQDIQGRRSNSQLEVIQKTHITYHVLMSLITTITKFWNLIGSWHTLFFAELERVQLKSPITNCPTWAKFAWCACMGPYLPPCHNWNVSFKVTFFYHRDEKL